MFHAVPLSISGVNYLQFFRLKKDDISYFRERESTPRKRTRTKRGEAEPGKNLSVLVLALTN